jgi:hypothetical protein
MCERKHSNANVPSYPILVTLMMEVIRGSVVVKALCYKP